MFCVEAFVVEQVGHSDDAVHGCANFVAHGGEELGFGALAIFGGAFGNGELFHVVFVGCDITLNRDDHFDIACLVVDRNLVGFDPDFCAVFAVVDELCAQRPP